MATPRRSAFAAARAVGDDPTVTPTPTPTGVGLIQAYEDAKSDEDAKAAAAAEADAAAQAAMETTDQRAMALSTGLKSHGARLKKDAAGNWIVWQWAPGDPGFVSFPIEEGDLPEEPVPTPTPTPTPEPEPTPTPTPA
jgi:hypothetical protein